MNWTFEVLQTLGIPAERGYPAAKLQMPEETVAAVTVERSTPKEAVLAIHILGPAGQGGRVCEDAAQSVATALLEKMASCQVGPCQFDSTTGIFSVKVLAHWTEFLEDSVFVGADLVSCATEFSAVQTRQVQQVEDEETGQVSIVNRDVIWTIALQEQLPLREVPAVDTKEAFALTVVHENCKEVYPQCYWLSITLEENDKGLLRKRIARSWTERVVADTTQS